MPTNRRTNRGSSMSNIPHVPADSVRPALVQWYRKIRRDLPWRTENPDPYAVWVSEIMLQQTRVVTVEPFYIRWMQRFPNIRALAAADEQEVLRLWAGLGYYARARNLHRAARIVVEQHNGILPTARADLLRLPGIGEYTAGAILSIAMEKPEPIVDANVERVLARMTCLALPTGKARAALWKCAASLADGEAPGDTNQALMELGALVCRSMDPLCDDCPVLAWCQGATTPDPTAYPLPAEHRSTVIEHHACTILLDGDQVLLTHRPPHGLWGGLWEFPRRVCEHQERPVECARRALLEIAGITAGKMVEIHKVRHVVTHHQITLHGFTCLTWSHQPTNGLAHHELRWVPLAEAQSLPLSAPQSAMLAHVTTHHIS